MPQLLGLISGAQRKDGYDASTLFDVSGFKSLNRSGWYWVPDTIYPFWWPVQNGTVAGISGQDANASFYLGMSLLGNVAPAPADVSVRLNSSFYDMGVTTDSYARTVPTRQWWYNLNINFMLAGNM